MDGNPPDDRPDVRPDDRPDERPDERPDAEGARTFATDGTTYDSFMGRYSGPLAERFAAAAGVRAGQSAVDVGCGPGALTGVLVDRLGDDAVAACDPSPAFLAACAARFPGVRVESGRAESIPFTTDGFDHALAQLVLHFVSDAPGAAREMARVVRPGGAVSACVWDFSDGMELLRGFWDVALTLDPDAPDEARELPFGRSGEIADLFSSVGLVDVEDTTLLVETTYRSFDELWHGFLAGVGPTGAYCVSLPTTVQQRFRALLHERFGSPDGEFTLTALAHSASATVDR